MAKGKPVKSQSAPARATLATRPATRATAEIEVPVAAAVSVPIVAIGASAGGLEALERLFDAMPVDTGLAFVIVQHLSPDFRSMMDELLARRSRMIIRHALDGLAIEPDTIYLNPPRQNLHIADNLLRLVAPKAGDIPNHPIDAFFESLAADRKEGATGVILSGTGNDGTRGAQAIVKAGGTVIVQEPGSAQFDNMPRNAIEKGAVSATALPEEMPALLLKQQRGMSLSRDLDLADTYELEPEDAILALLDRKFSANFAYYKKSTVRRRLERRASLSGLQDLANYLELLRSSPQELERLYADLLIGVTAFFRDRAAFNSLSSQAIPSICKKMSADRQVRIWIPGCASGEEPFSIAILAAEYARAHNVPLNVKIFATDLHNASLHVASQGIYPSERLKEIGPELRDRYFEPVGNRYQAKPNIRRMIVFSQHNVIKDPPFTRLDLISCRNMLIYFDDAAQRKVLALFHFALLQDAFLFLGPSESLADLDDEFETLDGRWRIFRKLRNIPLAGATRALPAMPAAAEDPSEKTAGPRRRDAARNLPSPRLDRRPLLHAYDAMLARYAPPSLLVSRQGELLHIFGNAHRYVQLRPGVLSFGMSDVVIDPLKHAATACFDEVRLTGSISGTKEVVFNDQQGATTVQLRGELLTSGGIDADHILITLTELTQTSVLALKESRPIEQFGERQALHGRVGELERNLRFTEESLQTTIEELETSNEELQSTNEELMSANEELQSTNEELHAVNEELYSISTEHQRKIQELTVTTNDLDHLLRCSDVGTLFLDKQLRVRRFTPAISASFNLLERDIGRPFSHITARFNYPTLADEVARVAASGEIAERTVDIGNTAMLLRIFPFRAGDDSDGVIITLVDISHLKTIERALAEKNQELGRLIASLQQFTYIVSHDLRAPLRSILNSAKWIEEDLGGTANDDVRGHTARLMTYSKRLTAMLDDLREYARLDIGDRIVGQIEVEQIVQSLVETLDGGQRLSVAISGATQAFPGYNTAITLVFQNLLDNAMKYGGEAVVTVKIFVEDLGQHLRFTVSDNGPGIPPRHHEKIFLPFRKLERQDNKPGTGMGLTLVKKAIEDNGGSIEVVSDPGKGPGTTFRFTWAKIDAAKLEALQLDELGAEPGAPN